MASTKRNGFLKKECIPIIHTVTSIFPFITEALPGHLRTSKIESLAIAAKLSILDVYGVCSFNVVEIQSTYCLYLQTVFIVYIRVFQLTFNALIKG